MKKRLNICPFDYFWINCVVNDELSIISSVEQSYETCGFLNDYRYSITGTSCWWRELMILPGDSLYNNLDVFQVNDLYINPDKIIEELISKLNMDCCISVLVDLYNWLPHSVNWQKNHYHHHRLLVGYDSDRQVFFTLGDTVNGYEESEVSFENLLNSIILNEDKFFVKHYTFDKTVTPYSYSFQEVYRFAKELKENLNCLLYSRTWIVPDDIDPLRVYTQVTKFADRQKANSMLLEKIKTDGLITNEQCSIFQEICKSIFNKWSILKGKLIKADIKRERLDIDYLNLSTNVALNEEYSFWCDFYNCISSKFAIELDSISYELDEFDKWSVKVVISYSNVQGKLNIVDGLNGFKIMLDTEENYVKSIKAFDNKIIIYTTISYYCFNQISDFKLYYKQAPISMITDDGGRFLPQLDGIKIDNVKKSRFITNMLYGVQEQTSIECIDFLCNLKIEYLPKIFKENICSLSEVVDSDKFSNTIVWFKFRYINEQEEELMLRIGHSDPIRIWINEEPFIFVRSKYTPISYNDVVIYTNEKNIEVIIAIEISKGNANLQDRGIIVRVDSL